MSMVMVPRMEPRTGSDESGVGMDTVGRMAGPTDRQGSLGGMVRLSELRIGGLALVWDHDAPSPAAVLFHPGDFRSRPAGPGSDGRWSRFLGFETTASAALGTLDVAGFTTEFFASVWESFRPRIDPAFREALEDDLGRRCGDDPEELERRMSEYWRGHPEKDAAGELHEFASFLREALEWRLSLPAFDEELELGGERVPSGEHFSARGDELVEFGAIRTYVIQKPSLFSPAVARLAGLFSDRFFAANPEVALLMYARLALEAAPPGGAVEWDLTDGVSSAEEARGEHARLSRELAARTGLLEQVLSRLSAATVGLGSAPSL